MKRATWSRLGIGIVSLLTSLVLGLLIASAKSTFDTTDSQMRAYAADFIVLDQVLRNYGPEADGVRNVLRVYVDRAIRSIWPEEAAGPALPVEDEMAGEHAGSRHAVRAGAEGDQPGPGAGCASRRWAPSRG